MLLGIVAVAAHSHANAQSKTTPQPAPQTQSGFEVASVRLSPPDAGFTSTSTYPSDRFTARNATLDYLIQIAYGVEQYQISGKPDWLESQEYDIAAKAEGDAGLSREQMQPLLQHLLEQRFHLKTHREQKEVPGYVLVLAKGEPKLQASKGANAGGQILPNGLQGRNMSVRGLASMLVIPTGRPIVDNTGIEGMYDFNLKYAPANDPNSSLPDLFTALQEQLGLKLESQKVPVEMLVIDRVDRIPTEN
jgi:uncharacterized protein (TIGR03435 family)